MSDGITDAYRMHKIVEREDALLQASIDMIRDPSEKNLQKVIESCDEFAKIPSSHGINPKAIAEAEKEFFQNRYGKDNFETSEEDVEDFLKRFQPPYRAGIREKINRKLF